MQSSQRFSIFCFIYSCFLKILSFFGGDFSSLGGDFSLRSLYFKMSHRSLANQKAGFLRITDRGNIINVILL